MNIDDYFNTVERSLLNAPHVSSLREPIECLASDDYNGLLRCRVFFWDDSYLDIYEVVSTELGYPVRIHYAYAYMRQEEHVFRYDNAPHHPEIGLTRITNTSALQNSAPPPIDPRLVKFWPRSRSG